MLDGILNNPIIKKSLVALAQKHMKEGGVQSFYIEFDTDAQPKIKCFPRTIIAYSGDIDNPDVTFFDITSYNTYVQLKDTIDYLKKINAELREQNQKLINE